MKTTHTLPETKFAIYSSRMQRFLVGVFAPRETITAHGSRWSEHAIDAALFDTEAAAKEWAARCGLTRTAGCPINVCAVTLPEVTR